MKVDEYKQVKMYKARHNDIKIFAVIKGRSLYEVVDTACKQYLEKESEKAVEKK
ncbi:MAG: hypothetical protein KAH03_08285 [Cocleimonas sp.]|nr:hypothetical protein [Cocleimonas sp.]